MTETRPEAAAEAPVAAPVAPVEPRGLAGWLTTSDHKRVGRMWLATSLLFLLAGGVLGALVGAERLDSGADLLKHGTFAQAYTAHAELAVLLFAVPFFIGLATYLVPLQVGSPEIAFPRGSATAYWGYLVSGLLLCASYVADGGITGSTETAVDLYLLSLLLLAASLALGAISTVTTAISMRAPGMTLLRTPMFTWSALVGGGLVLLSLPVLGARVVELFINHHHGGEVGSYDGIAWFWSIPSVYVLGVMAAGVLLEIVPTLAGRPLRYPVAGITVLGLMGLLSVGGWVLDPKATDDLLFVGMGLAAVIPALALLGLVGDTARAGRPKPAAPLVLSLGAALLLLAGAAAGAVEVIEPLDLLSPVPTTWVSGQLHLVLGAATVAAFAGLWFWAPKLWGAHLHDKLGYLVALLLVGGVALVAIPDLVSGAVDDQPVGAIEFDEESTTTGANALSLAGGAVTALGALVGVGAVLGASRKRAVPAVDDPWGGFTLEWTTTSPPPSYNFAEQPEIGEPA